MSAAQRTLLNPQYKHVLTGFILYDVKGSGAIQKIAKRRLDMISGNVASYSRVLNDAKRLKEVAEVNQLTSLCAEVSADIIQEKLRKKEKKAVEDKKKKEKAKKKEDEQAEKKRKALPIVEALMAPYVSNERDCSPENMDKLTAAQLKDILKYFFNYNKGLQKASKAMCVAKVVELFAERGSQKIGPVQNNETAPEP